MKITHKAFTPPLYLIFTLFLIMIMAFGCSQVDDENNVEPAKFTLTYNANGGIGEMKSVTSDKETEITLAAVTFSRIGYTFAGWNTKANGDGKGYANNEKIKLTANTTLYAQWTANKYTVKFDKNAEDATGNAPKDIQKAYDEEFTLPNNPFSRTNCNFIGWNTKPNGSGKNYAAGEKVKNLTEESNAVVSLYAQWLEKGAHIITFVLGIDENTQPMQFKEKEDVTLLEPERIGYIFDGWFEAKDFSGSAITGWNAGDRTQDVILYAKWTANKYTVKFDKNAEDATGNVPEDIQKAYDEEFALPDSLAKTGYTFSGWNTKPDGSGKNYLTETKMKNLAEDDGAEVTLYAQWTVNKYKVIFKENGGSGNVPEDIQMVYGEEFTLPNNTLTKIYYTLSGWNAKSDGSGKNYAAGEKVKNLTEENNAVVILYAKWTPEEYSITYELNTGINASNNPKKYTVEDLITLENPTKTGFTFLGWYTDSKFIEGSEVTEIKKGSTGNITLYAKWDFVKVPGLIIVGTESWTPNSNVFVSERNLRIKSFWMSDHEVTQAEYKAVMGNLPSGMAPAFGDSDNNPVNMVRWYDAIIYCNKRSVMDGLTPCYSINGSTDPSSWGNVPTTSGEDTWLNNVKCDWNANGYRLPTEAEWEWAARGGGDKTDYAGSNTIGDVAWYFGNRRAEQPSEDGTAEIKKKKANGYGLYDMSGNVDEWCWDRCSTDNPLTSGIPERGFENGYFRTYRGGNWLSIESKYCKVNYRKSSTPFQCFQTLGFRVVRKVE